MQYVAAFVFLMTLGLGVNYLMMHFVKGRLNRRKGAAAGEEDPLALEIKEDINKEIEPLKSALKELAQDIELKMQELDKKRDVLVSLVKAADERIAELSKLDSPKEDGIDWEALRLNKEQDFRRVYELHQQGMTNRDIARSLGIAVGEVELKLGLLNKVR